MTDEGQNDLARIADCWLTNWEQQCIQEIERENDYEEELKKENDLIKHKMWSLFQNSAGAVAQIYKDRHGGVSLWIPFQTAAGNVTNLYKESVEAFRRGAEIGAHCGSQKKTKDLLVWARKKRKHIRREELISFLAGKAAPQRHHHRPSPRPRHHSQDLYWSHHHQGERDEDDLSTFREALSMAALGQHSIRNSPSPGSPTYGSGYRRRTSPHHDLNTFICEELARHAPKRPAPASPSPPHDVIMDSPSHKRARLS